MPKCIPTEIVTTEKCGYGCGNIARYEFKSGKKCCSSSFQKCSAFIEQSIKVRKEQIDPVTGLNPLQRGQANATKMKHDQGLFAGIGKKISEGKNKLTKDGERRCDVSNRKMRETKLTVGEDGLTSAARTVRKAKQTRLADLDDRGLNSYQRWTERQIAGGKFEEGFEKAHQIIHYPGTDIRCQGSYEYQFIANLVSINGINWVNENVKRGPTLRYLDENGYSRVYLSDFIIGNTVYEIKSNWTWNKRGTDRSLEQKNINKLNSAVEAGYNVVLIREGMEINYGKKS